MKKDQQVNNILAFLAIVFGEDGFFESSIMKFPPDYLIEKFERYILSSRYEASWGIHPALRHQTLDKYCKQWKIKTGDELIDGEDDAN